MLDYRCVCVCDLFLFLQVRELEGLSRGALGVIAAIYIYTYILYMYPTYKTGLLPF